MRRRQRPIGEPPQWGSRKLLALVVGAGLTVVALLTGLGLAIYDTFQPDRSPTPDQAALVPAAADPRDELADRPMPTVPAAASRPGPLTTEPFESLLLPGARRLGPAGVSTGFPQTREGALAQLVAIDQAALQSASVPGAQAVITAWAVPGGPTAQSWSGVAAIAELLSAADLPASGSPSLTVSATPEMGLVKGIVGERYVVACVDFVVTATATTTARVAAADCQRMVWTDDNRAGRWMVGPGPEPVMAPSVWPGTEAAHTAGYLELSYE